MFSVTADTRAGPAQYSKAAEVAVPPVLSSARVRWTLRQASYNKQLPGPSCQSNQRPEDWQDFLNVCQRIGSVPGLVQGGGGNASVKENGQLHVKASGFWLKDSLAKDMFVALDLEKARAVAHSGEQSFENAILPGATAH